MAKQWKAEPKATPAELPRCKRCRWWVSKGKANNDEYGTCHRHPPQTGARPLGSFEGTRVSFPLLLANEWCGEFETAPATTTD